MKKTAENDFDKAVECIVKSDFNKNLNKCLDIVKELDKKDKEIERLNNIIKRLEEFIEYLEKRYKDITGVIGSYGSNTDMLYGKKDMIKEILKKCKEIEQGSDKE